ncbi:CHASE domain-containing protein [Massilia sp. DJPM01]|uniref:CHASE domain-containing protein n=1 Tax=Massilia sp. DJPM01 TaxID=3024404 RepID=UPI00259D998D|nr:CHASE domain-containing protein [Massilia sp. DJPM01]MDM5179820.1 CHASE domain-containing protein [Massilia sp. DJPM01]
MARPALWVGLPFSLAVGMVLYFATANSIEADSRTRFAGLAQNARNTISARIKSYTHVLRGTVSLFQISEPLTRHQFHGYVKGLDVTRNFPAIENINYAQLVHDADRDAFLQRMRDERVADGLAPQAFTIKPPGHRPTYTVVTFTEPEEPWAATLGYDLLANPLVHDTLANMRDTGKLIPSGMPVSFISGPKHTGLAMRLPVYKPHAPTITTEQRRAAYIGTVGIAFSVQKLVQGVIDEIPIKNVRMTLVDNAIGVDRRRGRVLFDSHPADENTLAPFLLAPSRFSATLPIDFNGRPWDATFSVDTTDMYTAFEEFAPWLALMAGSVSSMLLYALFHALTSSRRRAIKMAKGMTRELRDSQAKLQLSHQNLRRLAAHADQIKEGERKRIAREIHDDLGQNLLALRIEADMLSSRTRERHPRLHARARSTLQQIDATIKSVRQIINDLRPNVLDLGLSAAVEWQIAEFKRRTGIACELIDEPKEVALNDHAATAFFRILQESLSNIVRHAQATRVRVELKLTGNRLSMTVTDNGIGLQAGEQGKVGSFGLVGIEERISILGGSFSISSHGGDGTTVCVSVPLYNEPSRGGPADTASGKNESHAAFV